VTRRLDLLDGPEAGLLDRLPEGFGRGRNLRIAATTSMPSAARKSAIAIWRAATTAPVRVGDRAARDVRAAAADRRPGPGQDEGAGAVVVTRNRGSPTARASMLGPRAGLQDVTAGSVDRPRVPVDELLRTRVADVQSAPS
jgi:hypothetical protein